MHSSNASISTYLVSHMQAVVKNSKIICNESMIPTSTQYKNSNEWLVEECSGWPLDQGEYQLYEEAVIVLITGKLYG